MGNMRCNLLLVILFALLALSPGCRKEDSLADLGRSGSDREAQSAVPAGYSGGKRTGGGAGSPGVLDEYIANLRAFSYYSGALTLAPAEGNLRSAEGLHPETYKLQYEYAIAPDGTRQYDFFALDVKERAEFYEQVLEDEREFLAERLALEPSSAVALAARSRALRAVVGEYVGVEALQQLTESVKGGQSGGGDGGVVRELMAIDAVPELTMRARSEEMIRNLNEMMIRDYEEMGGGSSGSSSGSTSDAGDKRRDSVFAAKLRPIYRAKGVRRGQILYRGIWETSTTGHAAVILDPDIPEQRAGDHLLSIDAYKGGSSGSSSSSNSSNSSKDTLKPGVHPRPLSTWRYTHYVLGVRKIWYTWERSRWFFKKLVRHEERIYDMDEVARIAYERRGDPYSSHIFRSKHYDREFICSSLVWYSVKQGCGINLARWRQHTIWPTDLWLDSQTFVVAKVKR